MKNESDRKDRHRFFSSVCTIWSKDIYLQKRGIFMPYMDAIQETSYLSVPSATIYRKIMRNFY